jgi:hypothetical protein
MPRPPDCTGDAAARPGDLARLRGEIRPRPWCAGNARSRAGDDGLAQIVANAASGISIEVRSSLPIIAAFTATVGRTFCAKYSAAYFLPV